jgi:sulfofructose kinase
MINEGANGTVFAVGALLVDHVLCVGTFPPIDGGALLTQVIEMPGGVAGNTAVALARLGVSVTLGTFLGEDIQGASLRSKMKSEGVTVNAFTMPDSPSPATYVVVDASNGSRRWFADLGRLLEAPWPTTWNKVLCRASLLFLDGQPPQPALTGIAAARERGIRIAMDVSSLEYFNEIGWSTEGLVAAIADIDIFMPSASAAQAISGMSSVENATRFLSRLVRAEVVVTNGAEGAVVATRIHGWHVSAPTIQPVDTTGAGDAFHAGYLFGRLSGLTPIKAAGLGTQVASCAVMKVGAQSGLPRLSQLAGLPQPVVTRLW